MLYCFYLYIFIYINLLYIFVYLFLELGYIGVRFVLVLEGFVDLYRGGDYFNKIGRVLDG